MRKGIFNGLIITAGLGFLSSCDIIDEPYQTGGTTGGGTEEVVRNILIEDFTGHTCGNCWEAADIADNLVDLYGDRVIVIGTHVGFFAKPKSNPEGKYAYDFRTTAGTDIDALYEASAVGLPQGMVSRKVDGAGKIVQPRGAWGSAVADMINDETPPLVDIKMTSTYTEASKSAELKVSVNYLDEGPTSYKLVVNVLESHIISWQKIYTDTLDYDKADYQHNHVLRKSISATFGDELSATVVAPGATIDKNYTINKDEEWVYENVEIVAYVLDASTEEVVQAAKIKL
ncbi:MAG: hypothetical protein ACJATA_000899 [Sphingobacteriales bacterium]|jgi:hypothetical protein